MLVNKYINLAMSAAIALTGAAAAFDWTSILSPEKAGAVAGAIGVVKMIINVLAPSPGQVSTPTGGTIVTHS